MRLPVPLSLGVDVDSVLRAQGADPALVRGHSPRLAALAAEAVAIGMPLLAPRAACQLWEVEAPGPGAVFLRGGKVLSGPLLIHCLEGAQQVAAVVATLGPALEAHIAALIPRQAALALALEGFGSAAVEALCTAICHNLGEQATLPLSPGLEGWPLESGQRELFALLDAGEAGVRLTASSLMLPRKSASFVVGLGPGAKTGGSACAFCQARERCRYRRADAV